jgi:hypothetical protein
VSSILREIRQISKNQEKIMADYTRLTAAIADVNTKIDALIAKPAPQAPVDDQPAVDALVAQVEAISAKIPA